jgi:hypothetical protein
VEHGRKDSTKDEFKKANRKGQTASRTYTIEKVSHEVLTFYWSKVYYGVSRPYSTCAMCLPGAQLAKKVTYDQRSASFQTEIGLRLVPREGGAPWGPFWPEYDGVGATVNKPMYEKVKEELERQKRKFAEDIANGEIPL